MCFEFDAQPPDLPIMGSAASSEQLVLTSADGTRFAAYASRPAAPNGAGIVILPDVRGLFRFYEELAERFAAAGVEAIAIDYFGRTAGLTARDESFEYMPHVEQTQSDQIAQDVSAAVAYLRQRSPAPRTIFTVGFCFGGGQSFLQAAQQHGLSGVIGFYGSPTRRRQGGSAPIELIQQYECPVLGLFGGADQGIPEADVHAYDAALAQAGIDHEIHIYPGAPHSFFDRRQADYERESTDAWQRMLTFIANHTPQE